MKKKISASLALMVCLYLPLFYNLHQRKFKGPVEKESAKIMGNPSATHTLTLFSDFACTYCNQLRLEIEKLLSKRNDINIQYKHFPLNKHASAEYAAEASECAADQGEFWPYHDLLFNTVPEWFGKTPEVRFDVLMRHANSLGLDLNSFSQCLTSRSKKLLVEKNKDEGRRFFVSGTPTLILDGKKIIVKNTIEEIEKDVAALDNKE